MYHNCITHLAKDVPKTNNIIIENQFNGSYPHLLPSYAIWLNSNVERECARTDWKRTSNTQTWKIDDCWQQLFIFGYTREKRVICGRTAQIAFIMSFPVAEILSHAYYTVDLDLIWPFSFNRSLAIQTIAAILFEVLSTFTIRRMIFADFVFWFLFIRWNGTRNLAHTKSDIQYVLIFSSLIDFDLLWKLKPLCMLHFFLRLRFFAVPRKKIKENN